MNPPIYLRVPPGHSKNWSKHCRSYNACNQRVYFVNNDWYDNVYVPQHRDRNDGRREYRDDGRDYQRDEGRGRDKHDKHEKHDKHDKHGKGHGNGHGKGNDRD